MRVTRPTIAAIFLSLAALGLLGRPSAPAAAPQVSRELAARSRPVSRPPAVSEVPEAPGTTLVVLKVTRSAVSLVATAEKTVPYGEPAAPSGDERWRLADPRTGRVLAEGDLSLPDLCPCGASEDHARGCVVVPHEAVVRLKLPRVARRERLSLLHAGRELASFDLEVRS